MERYRLRKTGTESIPAVDGEASILVKRYRLASTDYRVGRSIIGRMAQYEAFTLMRLRKHASIGTWLAAKDLNEAIRDLNFKAEKQRRMKPATQAQA